MGEEIEFLAVADGRNNGGSEQLTPTQAEPQLILETKGGSDISPQLVTVQCSLEITQPQSGTPSIIDVRGYVDWGISGCSHKGQFDWIQGCAFTLAATSVKLRAKLRSDLSPGTKVFAKASVAYGTKAVVPLQQSSDYHVIPTGGSVILDIPPWATHGLLVAMPFSVLALRNVRLEAMTYTGVVRYEVWPNDCMEANRFPLSSDVQKLRVTSQAEAGDTTICVIWRLSL